MFHIKNKELSVQVIDPVEDKNLLGPRYCAGGYIFQVQDNSRGNLLGGPQFPDGNYDVFDGQGAPEVFETALNQDRANVNEEVLVIGVGLVSRTSSNSPFHVRDNPNCKRIHRLANRTKSTLHYNENEAKFYGVGIGTLPGINYSKTNFKIPNFFKKCRSKSLADSMVCSSFFSLSQRFSGLQVFGPVDF